MAQGYDDMAAFACKTLAASCCCRLLWLLKRLTSASLPCSSNFGSPCLPGWAFSHLFHRCVCGAEMSDYGDDTTTFNFNLALVYPWLTQVGAGRALAACAGLGMLKTLSASRPTYGSKGTGAHVCCMSSCAASSHHAFPLPHLPCTLLTPPTGL